MLHLLLFALPAFAFHVPDHLEITSRAVHELAACGRLPQGWTDQWTQDVKDADESEDYDLIRKWSTYSHYYNPYHPLNQYRDDSSVTINESVDEIKANSTDSLLIRQRIGRIAHHLQDANTPAHAVPVSHAFSDGFEVFDIAAYFAEPLSPAACPTIAMAEPAALLHDNAVATLDSLHTPFVYKAGQRKLQGTWDSAFYVAGQGNEFGDYGPVGNAFGDSSVTFADGTVGKIASDQYFQFKRTRAEAAVHATEAVILWAAHLRGY
jgi:hypothetical protein